MVTLQACWRTVRLVIRLCPVLLVTACPPPPTTGSIRLSSVSPNVAKPGQLIVINVVTYNPVIQPCRVTITQSGLSVPLATFDAPPPSIHYTIPANAPLGTYTVVGTCVGITSSPVQLVIINPPMISEYGPVPAPIGLIEQIDGTGFGTSQGSGVIELLQSDGGPKGTKIGSVTYWSDTKIVFTLPTVPLGTYQLAVHTASNGDSAPVGPYTVVPAVQFLWVADSLNNRVVGLTAPITSGEAFGHTFTQVGLLHPGGLAIDPGHDLLWISDTGNSRVLQMTVPGVLNEAPNIVIGKSFSCPSGSAAIPPATASTFCNPAGIAVDTHENLWIADTGNNRILKFSPPYAQASLVIGQATLTQNQCATSATSLCQPQAIALDSFGNLWVADTLGNRVLEYLQPFSNGQGADFVLGQTSMNNGGYNQGYAFTQWNAFANPTGVAFDAAGDLWVTDSHNGRLLEFVPLSQNSGSGPFSEFPDFVVGQTNMYSGNIYSNNTCLNSSLATQSSLCEPNSLLFDSSGNMFVSDTFNNRVLSGTISVSGKNTKSLIDESVLGQATFSQKGAGNGPAGLNLPASAAWQVFRGQ